MQGLVRHVCPPCHILDPASPRARMEASLGGVDISSVPNGRLLRRVPSLLERGREWTAPRVKSRPFSQRKRDCQMHHPSEGPLAFVQPLPSPE